MSGPKRPAATKFSESLRLWRVSVAEWLGLDPARLLALDSDRDDEIPGYFTVEWKTVGEELRTARGEMMPPSISLVDVDPYVCHSGVALTYAEGRALYEAVGEKPRLMSVEQELMLRGLARP